MKLWTMVVTLAVSISTQQVAHLKDILKFILFTEVQETRLRKHFSKPEQALLPGTATLVTSCNLQERHFCTYWMFPKQVEIPSLQTKLRHIIALVKDLKKDFMVSKLLILESNRSMLQERKVVPFEESQW